jgi:hypothetical protein
VSSLVNDLGVIFNVCALINIQHNCHCTVPDYSPSPGLEIQGVWTLNFSFLCPTSLEKDWYDLINLTWELKAHLILLHISSITHDLGPSFQVLRSLASTQYSIFPMGTSHSNPFLVLLLQIFGFPYCFVRALRISWIWTICLFHMLKSLSVSHLWIGSFLQCWGLKRALHQVLYHWATPQPTETCTLVTGFLTLALLTFWAESFLGGCCPVHSRMLSSLPGPIIRDARSTPQVASGDPQVSPDIAKCSPGATLPTQMRSTALWSLISVLVSFSNMCLQSPFLTYNFF